VPIPRQKCAQGHGLAVLFSLSRRDFATFICNEFLTQDTSAALHRIWSVLIPALAYISLELFLKDKSAAIASYRATAKKCGQARAKGYGAGKNVSDSKRQMAVDTKGLPHAIEVTTADVNDRNGAMLLFNDDTLSEVKTVLVDGAYMGERFNGLVWRILGARVEVVKRSALQHSAFLEPPRSTALLLYEQQNE
jgi:transposase